MRSVIQRVKCAHVEVQGQTVGRIAQGLMVLLGVEEGDTASDLDYTVQKIAHMRIFSDEDGKMNRSVLEIGGEVLLVSQFTLLGDVRHGRRPGFTGAAAPEVANAAYEQCAEKLRALGLTVQTGCFQTDMQVHLINDGPVTLLLDSRKKF